MAAQRDDPDVAAAVAGLPEERRRWRPPAAGWTTESELLARAVDRLGRVETLLADMPTAVRKRSQPPDSFPRPVTEVDRARARAEQRIEAELDELVAAAHATYAAERDGG